MKKLMIVTSMALALPFSLNAVTAFAQEKPAIATPTDSNPEAPVAGKNSFTEEQAKKRFEEKGYANVTALKIDEQGVWRAEGVKGGNPVMLTLDYQGNITEGAE